MGDSENIKSRIRDYVLQEFLPDEDPEDLEDDTELMALGILDSVSVMQMVVYLEEAFGVTFEASEVGIEHMNSLNDISRTVASKIAV